MDLVAPAVALCAWIVVATTVTRFPAVSGETINANASAVLHGKVQLPCDITPPSPDDKTHLVLWFKVSSGVPIYSLDLRHKPVTETPPLNYAVEDIRSRCSFHTESNALAYLVVDDVRDEDEGVYRCRVDFRKAHTRNYLVSLAVIVPPKQPTILGEKGLELSSVVGPYNEGSSFFLSCEAVGGRPPPRVTWWREKQLLDDSYEVTSLGIVRNDLLVQSLTRHDFNAVFTCQATNNNITTPASTSVTVNMNLKPLEVKILNTERPLSTSRRYELVCQSVGSRPPPIIAWWKGEKRMKRTEETMSHDTNVTTSILLFTPTSQDHAKTLSCRAENPAIPNSAIQNHWKLNVHYRPIATLELGSSFDLDNICQGDNIYLECSIQANPSVIKLEWRFQGKPIVTDVGSGVITSNQSLLLQRVKRTQGGEYSCVGINSEGDGESNRITLRVKHIPVCKSGQKTTYKAARHETVTVSCQVDAHPSELTFRWAFNHTTNFVEEGPALITTDLLSSSLVYTPKTRNDFGTFYCVASNEMGTQHKPCAFTLLPEGPPDPVYNCTIFNETWSSFMVDCQPGYNGGLAQIFVCDVVQAESRQLVTKINSSSSVFTVTNLPSGSRFLVSVYASNAKGRSESLDTTANTAINADKHLGVEGWLSTVFGVVLGAVIVLALLGVTVIIVARVRSRRHCRRKEYEVEQADRSHVPLRRDVDEGVEGGEEKSPDVIPNSTDQEFPSVKVKCVQPKWAYCKQGPCDNCRHSAAINSFGSLPHDNNYKYQMRKIIPFEDSAHQQEISLHTGARAFATPCGPRWMSPEVSDPPNTCTNHETSLHGPTDTSL